MSSSPSSTSAASKQSACDDARGFGFAKIILLGEHAVVYGKPALACGLDGGAESFLLNPREATPGTLYFAAPIAHELGGTTSPPDFNDLSEAPKREQLAYQTLAEAILPQGFPLPHIAVRLGVPPGIGLGSSAAVGVAIARCLNQLNPTSPRDATELLAAVALWENQFHGKASGVDAAAAFYGCPLHFQREQAIQPLSLMNAASSAAHSTPLPMLIWAVEPPASTRAMVEALAERHQLSPRQFDEYFESIAQLVNQAEALLKSPEQPNIHQRFAALMDDNQKLLEIIGVSTPGLNRAIQILKAQGALGAKLTGSGGGGCVIALFADEKQALETSRKLHQPSAPCFVRTICLASSN